jgi:hypothetical protein
MILFGLGIVVGAIAIDFYYDSDFYRRRFEPTFRQLRAGDTHERMISLLGHPTQYSKIAEIR